VKTLNLRAMRKYFSALMVLIALASLTGCGSSHSHKPSEASKFSDDIRVK
jgi:uncharacterized lipoprotein YehR (DUF1307 family)